MIDKKDIERLKRFSKGLTSNEEDRYIYSLFTENEGNKEFEKHLKQDFDQYLLEHPEEDHNLSYLLDRIHHRIHTNEYQKSHSVVKRIYNWYSVTAAVLLLPLIIAGGIWIAEQNRQAEMVAEAQVTSTLFAPLGSRINFSLPDGTTGWLNSGSSIEYSLPFISTRNIALKGEAWFDVAHDEEHAFEVAAGDSKVKVLGTKFNVNAYPEEKYMEVVLEEGKVEFSTVGLSSGVEMKPNDRLVLNKGKVNIEKTDAEKYGAWKDGKLVFRSEPMAEVARRIGRWYNVEVELVDKELENYSIRGTFQDDSLEEVFRYLSMTSPIRYEIQSRKMLADGTWQKQKVLLYKKNN